MNDKPTQTLLATRADPEETPDGFLTRWSRRKLAPHDTDPDASATVAPAPEVPPVTEPVPLTDADMPALDTLDENSDYRGFLSSEVSEPLRKAALKKLFHLSGFNIRDGLDDYDEDFTFFEPLGDIVTADMRHQMELAEERMKAAAEAAEDEIAVTEPCGTQPAAIADEPGEPDTTDAIEHGDPSQDEKLS